MLSQHQVFDLRYLTGLIEEWRRATRKLLFDLCDELDGPCRRAAAEWQLPVDLLRLAGRSLAVEDFSRARVAGWIDQLNDLVFFLDLRQQLRQDRDPAEFARQCFEHCRKEFYENRYLDDLFPLGWPQRAGLDRRIAALCGRLARQVAHDAFLMDGKSTLAWLAGQGKGRPRDRTIIAPLGEDPERAELPDRLYLGPEGAEVRLPKGFHGRSQRRSAPFCWDIRPPRLFLRGSGGRIPLFESLPGRGWRWQPATPDSLIQSSPRWPTGLSLGPTLEYDADLAPRRVVASAPAIGRRIAQAVAAIRAAWPEGAALLGLFTERILPLRAKGVVSFSYRHRPGLSFINTFDRNQLDLIDDVIHENSHQHLNLLLRKFDLRRGDHNREIFYSPWRRSLRPLHGILHATFTFTVGAMLFERLATWGGRSGSAARLKAFGLTARDVQRARCRCLEEVASVEFSLQDLTRAAAELKWLSPSGIALVRALALQIAAVKRRSAAFRPSVLRSSFGPALRRHERGLAEARRTYGQAGKVRG